MDDIRYHAYYSWVLHQPASCVHRVPHAVLLAAPAQLLKHSLNLRSADKASAMVLEDPSLALNAVRLGKNAWRGIGTLTAGQRTYLPTERCTLQAACCVPAIEALMSSHYHGSKTSRVLAHVRNVPLLHAHLDLRPCSQEPTAPGSSVARRYFSLQRAGWLC